MHTETSTRLLTSVQTVSNTTNSLRVNLLEGQSLEVGGGAGEAWMGRRGGNGGHSRGSMAEGARVASLTEHV